MVIDLSNILEKGSGRSNELLYQLIESFTDYAIFVADPDYEINLYRIVPEALNNTAKHSAATRASKSAIDPSSLRTMDRI